jgi:predicted O-methyltransferase YrrM
MCQLYPNLRVVGLDVLETSLAEARRNVADAHLGGRIELRLQGVQDMTDNNAFDLAWFPHAFIPGEVIPQGLRAVWRALRPGGWILTGGAAKNLVVRGSSSYSNNNSDLSIALDRLRSTLWEGEVRLPEQIEAMLTEAGFEDVQAIPLPREFRAQIEGRPVEEEKGRSNSSGGGGFAIVGRRPS